MKRLTRDELIARVQRIMDVDGSDDQLEELANEVNGNVPHPDVTELIFDETESLTAEQVVDLALSYRRAAIELGAGDDPGENGE